MSEQQTKRGPRWRWIWAFVFVFSTHAALVFWVGERTHPITTPAAPAPLLYVATTPTVVEQLALLAPASDPTLFALANARGFSGEAWLNFVPMDVALSNWTATPSWLPIPIDELGSPIAFFARSNRLSGADLAQQVRPLAPFEPRTPSAPVLAQTTFRLEGPAASRFVKGPARIPAVTNLDLMPNTMVDLAVRGDGVVESAMLAIACGINEVDEYALAVGRSMQFAPLNLDRRELDRIPLSRARVVFTWHAVPPNPTNAFAFASP